MKPCQQGDNQSTLQGQQSSPMSSCSCSSSTKDEAHTVKLRLESCQFYPGECEQNIIAKGEWLDEAIFPSFDNLAEEYSQKLATATKDENLDYLFVIDFECNQPGSEIIEFPIVVVDLHKKDIVDSFHSFVRPTAYPQLSKFIKDLTGITQKDVETAEELHVVLNKAEKFLSKYAGSSCSILYDCDNDAKFLKEELKAKNLRIKQSFLMSYINLRNVFPLSSTGGLKNRSLGHALEVLNMEFKGKQHSGKDDATNIARVCIGLLTEVHDFRFTSFMRQSQFYPDMPKKYVQDSLSSLFLHSTHVVSLNIEFETVKPAKSNSEIQHCRSFKLVLFSRATKPLGLGSPSNNTTSSPNKEEKTVNNQQNAKINNRNSPGSSKKLSLSSSSSGYAVFSPEQCLSSPSTILIESPAPTAKSPLVSLATSDQSDFLEVAKIDKQFLNETTLCEDYFKLLQELISLYTLHNVKKNNTIVILSGLSKPASMKKFLKDLPQLFQADKNLLVFKYKMLFFPEILEKLQISQAVVQDITSQAFPQAINMLIEWFKSTGYGLHDKQLPKSDISTEYSSSNSVSPFTKLFQSCLPTQLYPPNQQYFEQTFDTVNLNTSIPVETVSISQQKTTLAQKKLLNSAKQQSQQQLALSQQQTQQQLSYQYLFQQQQLQSQQQFQGYPPMLNGFETISMFPYPPYNPSDPLLQFPSNLMYNTMIYQQNEGELQKINMQLEQLKYQIDGTIIKSAQQQIALDQLKQQYQVLLLAQQQLLQQQQSLQMQIQQQQQQQQQQNQTQQFQQQQQYMQMWLQQQQQYQNNYFAQQRQAYPQLVNPNNGEESQTIQLKSSQESSLSSSASQTQDQQLLDFQPSKELNDSKYQDNSNYSNSTQYQHKKKQWHKGNNNNNYRNHNKDCFQQTIINKPSNNVKNTNNQNTTSTTVSDYLSSSSQSTSSTHKKAPLSPSSLPFQQADKPSTSNGQSKIQTKTTSNYINNNNNTSHNSFVGKNKFNKK